MLERELGTMYMYTCILYTGSISSITAKYLAWWKPDIIIYALQLHNIIPFDFLDYTSLIYRFNFCKNVGKKAQMFENSFSEKWGLEDVNFGANN